MGGLGVTDLRFFGFALRLRWEWLSRTEPERGWAALPERKEKVVASMAAASMSIVPGDGASTRLWTDNWAAVGPLCTFAPQLFAALSAAGKKQMLKEGLVGYRWARAIVAAPTVQVLLQYVRV
jgi:hypothetical protein